MISNNFSSQIFIQPEVEKSVRMTEYSEFNNTQINPLPLGQPLMFLNPQFLPQIVLSHQFENIVDEKQFSPIKNTALNCYTATFKQLDPKVYARCKRKEKTVRCNSCNLVLNSPRQARQHFNGKFHLRILKKIKKKSGERENKLTENPGKDSNLQNEDKIASSEEDRRQEIDSCAFKTFSNDRTVKGAISDCPQKDDSCEPFNRNYSFSNKLREDMNSENIKNGEKETKEISLENTGANSELENYDGKNHHLSNIL